MEVPETRYARSGEMSIAYQVFGDGPVDLVYVPGFVSHVDDQWDVPRQAAFLRALGRIARVLIFDKRGTGLSDRVAGAPDLETRMDDVRAVMDAAGSERAVLTGISEGGPMCLLFAATYPERAPALVLYGTFAPRAVGAGLSVGRGRRTVRAPRPDRVLATVLFTDLVGSTASAVELGDARGGATSSSSTTAGCAPS